MSFRKDIWHKSVNRCQKAWIFVTWAGSVASSATTWSRGDDRRTPKASRACRRTRRNSAPTGVALMPMHTRLQRLHRVTPCAWPRRQTAKRQAVNAGSLASSTLSPKLHIAAAAIAANEFASAVAMQCIHVVDTRDRFASVQQKWAITRKNRSQRL